MHIHTYIFDVRSQTATVIVLSRCSCSSLFNKVKGAVSSRSCVSEIAMNINTHITCMTYSKKKVIRCQCVSSPLQIFWFMFALLHIIRYRHNIHMRINMRIKYRYSRFFIKIKIKAVQIIRKRIMNACSIKLHIVINEYFGEKNGNELNRWSINAFEFFPSPWLRISNSDHSRLLGSFGWIVDLNFAKCKQISWPCVDSGFLSLT